MSGFSRDRIDSRERHLKDIRAAHLALAGPLQVIFIGGKVLALYAKATGDALRPTNDIDGVVPVDFGRYQFELQKLLAARVLRLPPSEDREGAPPCRYQLVDGELNIDLLDLGGHQVGGVNPYLATAVSACAEYDAGEGVRVRAITPPYFLLTKLVSLRDPERTGTEPVQHWDAEDIVSVFVEVDDILSQVEGAGLLNDVQREFAETLRVLQVTDVVPFLDLWLRPDVPERHRIVREFRWLALREPR